MSDWVNEAMRRQAAEIDRLRAELAELRVNSNAWRNDALLAEAALARVRELCEGWPSWREVTAAEVLRALEGEQP